MAKKHFEIETSDTGKYCFTQKDELKLTKVESVRLNEKCIWEYGTEVVATEANRSLVEKIVDAITKLIMIAITLLELSLILCFEGMAKGEGQNRLSLVVAIWGLLTTAVSLRFSLIKKVVIQIIAIIMECISRLYSLITRKTYRKTDVKISRDTEIFLIMLIQFGALDLAGLIVVALLKIGVPISFANTVSAFAIVLPLEVIILGNKDA